MTFVCLSSPAWPTAAGWSTEFAAKALSHAPRVRLELANGLVWADARGLDGYQIAERLLALAESTEVSGARAGIASTPIAALIAARIGSDRITVVPADTDRSYLAPLDLGVLEPPPPANLYPLLAGVGLESCGDLARLDSESVEIRFGSEGVRLWHLSRADDRRPIFGPRPRELPTAELEWVDYELDNQERVIFIVHSLLGTVVEELSRKREGAHAMVLEFSLSDRTVSSHPIRCSHPTADRKTWLRVIRAALEPVTFTAPVTKISLRVEAATPLVDRQGSLFDHGFATARSTEMALAHLLDKQSDAVVVAERSLHPLPELRVGWAADPSGQVSDQVGIGITNEAVPCLTLQLANPIPSIDVQSATRRGNRIPLRYFDGARNYSLTTCLGPDRVAGGFGEHRFERDYFQGIRDDGVMVLLYRDRETDQWFLGGWWD